MHQGQSRFIPINWILDFDEIDSIVETQSLKLSEMNYN